MELIYMYIKSYRNKNDDDLENQNGFRIEDIGINFSDKFQCRAEKPDNGDLDGINLIIEKRETAYKDFYSENIKSMKVIAGKNGSGKTTLMDILGMTREQRRNDSYFLKNIQNGKAQMKGYSADYIMIYDVSHNENGDEHKDEFLMEILGNFKAYKNGKEIRNKWILNLDKSIYGDKIDKKSLGSNMIFDIPVGFIIKYNFQNNQIQSTKNFCYDKLGHTKTVLVDMIKYYYIFNNPTCRMRGVEEYSNSLLIRNHMNNQYNTYNEYKSLYNMFTKFKLKEVIKSSSKSENYLHYDPIIRMMYNYQKSMYILGVWEDDTGKWDKEKNKIEEYTGVIQKKLSIQDKYLKKTGKEYYIRNIIKQNLDNNMYEFFNIISKNFNVGNDESTDSLKEDKLEEIYEKLKIENEIIDLNLEETKNIYQELENIVSLIKFLNKKIEGSNELSKLSIIEGFCTECFEKMDLINRNIIISRYIVSRIESIKYFLENSIHNLGFEYIIKCISKLDEKYFKNDFLEFDLNLNEDEDVVEFLNNIIEVENGEKQKNDYRFPNGLKMFDIYIPYASDGEKKMISLLSKLGSILEDETAQHHIILLDEPDREMHPEWSRNFIDIVIKMVEILNEGIKEKSKGERKLSTQIVISTNSPFLLSDIRKEDIVLLDLDESIPSDKRSMALLENGINKTFGANIHNLLKESFFMSSTIGEFASKKLEQDLEPFELDDEKFREKYSNDGQEHPDLLKIKYLLDEIGEPILKKEIEKEWNKKMELIGEKSDINAMIDSFKGLSENDQKLFVKKLLENIE